MSGEVALFNGMELGLRYSMGSSQNDLFVSSLLVTATALLLGNILGFFRKFI